MAVADAPAAAADWRRGAAGRGRCARSGGARCSSAPSSSRSASRASPSSLTGAYLSFSIGNDLFQSRLQQVASRLRRATRRAEHPRRVRRHASGDRRLQQLWAACGRSPSTSGRGSSPSYRTPGQDTGPVAPPDFASPGSAAVSSRDALTEAVAGDAGHARSLAVGLPHRGRRTSTAGIVVGSALTMPTAGPYELYLGYDLERSRADARLRPTDPLPRGLAPHPPRSG